MFHPVVSAGMQGMVEVITVKRLVKSGLFLLCWLAGLLLPLQLLQASGAPFSSGLLFQIEHSGEPVGFLFGTIHSEDPRVLDLPPDVERAFVQSSLLCLEVDMAPANLLAPMTTMFLADGRKLPAVIGPERYAKLVPAAAKRGIPEVSLRYYKPWAIAVLLSTPPVETGEFLDLMLYRRAVQMGKPVMGLESVEEQLDLFDKLPETDQVNLLEDSLNNLDQLPTLFKTLLETYLRRDLARLMEINEQLMLGEDQVFADRLQEQLLDQRNRRMVERLQAPLMEGNVFIAVGALHLPGEQGMLRLLQERGYQVVRKY